MYAQIERWAMLLVAALLASGDFSAPNSCSLHDFLVLSGEYLRATTAKETHYAALDIALPGACVEEIAKYESATSEQFAFGWLPASGFPSFFSHAYAKLPNGAAIQQLQGFFNALFLLYCNWRL